MRLRFLLLFLLLANFSFSQESTTGGTITGTVIDKKSGETLPGVNIVLEGASKGAQTDFDGKFTIKNVPAGTYRLRCSMISYTTQLVEQIVVKDGKSTLANVAMQSADNLLDSIIIMDWKRSNTVASTIEEMHGTNGVLNVVSQSQIAAAKDPDAGQVLKRLPGVTIIENRFIMVRGLSERYNNVWLNDAGAPSAETDKRAFSFDMIPSGLLDRILIYKTPSPELPGDFAGGMVKIYTRSFPDKAELGVTYTGSYREGTTGATRYYNDGSSSDKLGYDNGSRNMPDGTPAYINRNDANNAAVSRAFSNSWAIREGAAAPDQRFNLMYAQPVHFKKHENLLLGNTFGIGYTNLFTTYTMHRQDWDSTAQQSDYTDIQSTHTVRTNLVENISLMAGNSKIEFRNLLNQQGREWLTKRESNFLDGPNEKSYVMGYENRLITSSQLTGNHKSKNERTEYSWAGGFSYTERNAPDLRRIKYTKQRTDADTMYKAQIANVVDPVNGGGRLYSYLQERVYSFNNNLKHKFTIHDYEFEVNVGGYAEYKSRQFIARIIGYVINPSFTAYMFTRQPINDIFNADHVGVPGGFKMDEITSPSDKYTAQNHQYSGYGSLALPIGKKIKLTGGARYEYNEQALQSFVNLDSVSPRIITRFILPSTTLTYNFSEKMLVRGAYGKTLNRPEFREWSPFYFYDFDFSAGTYGSLFPTVLSPNGSVLRVAQVDNYDLRYEWYPTRSEYIQFGAFYKTFIDPIQQVILPSGGSDSRAFSFANAQYAYAEGFELDVRRNLAGLDSMLSTKVFGNFNIVANASLIKSRVYIDQVVNQAKSNPLQGQSPYVINGGIYYQNDTIGLQASLLYNVFGPRLYLLGTLQYASIGEIQRHTLDLSVTQRVWKGFAVTAGIQDIFNNPVRLVQDTNRDGKFSKSGEDEEILNYKRGRYYTFGFRYTLSGK